MKPKKKGNRGDCIRQELCTKKLRCRKRTRAKEGVGFIISELTRSIIEWTAINSRITQLNTELEEQIIHIQTRALRKTDENEKDLFYSTLQNTTFCLLFLLAKLDNA